MERSKILERSVILPFIIVVIIAFAGCGGGSGPVAVSPVGDADLYLAKSTADDNIDGGDEAAVDETFVYMRMPAAEYLAAAQEMYAQAETLYSEYNKIIYGTGEGLGTGYVMDETAPVSKADEGLVAEKYDAARELLDDAMAMAVGVTAQGDADRGAVRGMLKKLSRLNNRMSYEHAVYVAKLLPSAQKGNNYKDIFYLTDKATKWTDNAAREYGEYLELLAVVEHSYLLPDARESYAEKAAKSLKRAVTWLEKAAAVTDTVTAPEWEESRWLRDINTNVHKTLRGYLTGHATSDNPDVFFDDSIQPVELPDTSAAQLSASEYNDLVTSVMQQVRIIYRKQNHLVFGADEGPGYSYPVDGLDGMLSKADAMIAENNYETMKTLLTETGALASKVVLEPGEDIRSFNRPNKVLFRFMRRMMFEHAMHVKRMFPSTYRGKGVDTFMEFSAKVAPIIESAEADFAEYDRIVKQIKKGDADPALAAQARELFDSAAAKSWQVIDMTDTIIVVSWDEYRWFNTIQSRSVVLLRNYLYQRLADGVI